MMKRRNVEITSHSTLFITYRLHLSATVSQVWLSFYTKWMRWQCDKSVIEARSLSHAVFLSPFFSITGRPKKKQPYYRSPETSKNWSIKKIAPSHRNLTSHLMWWHTRGAVSSILHILPWRPRSSHPLGPFGHLSWSLTESFLQDTYTFLEGWDVSKGSKRFLRILSNMSSPQI